MNSSEKKAGTTQVVKQALEYLRSAEGRQALQEAAAESKKAAEPYRKAREVEPERLNRRFTV